MYAAQIHLDQHPKECAFVVRCVRRLITVTLSYRGKRRAEFVQALDGQMRHIEALGISSKIAAVKLRREVELEICDSKRRQNSHDCVRPRAQIYTLLTAVEKMRRNCG